jgi:hypothetical protein
MRLGVANLQIEIEDPIDFLSFGSLLLQPVGNDVLVIGSPLVSSASDGRRQRGSSIQDICDFFSDDSFEICADTDKFRWVSRFFDGRSIPKLLVVNGCLSSLPAKFRSMLYASPELFALQQVAIWSPTNHYQSSSHNGSPYSWECANQFASPAATSDLTSSLPGHWSVAVHKPRPTAVVASVGQFGFWSSRPLRSPKFSVVMPHYNHWGVVGDAVSSVERAGVGHEVEIIFVDDASSQEGTPPRITLPHKMLRHAKNQGVSGALNTGISHASGDFICWLSADDLYLPNFFSLREMLFLHRPDLDAVYGDCLYTQIGSNRYSRTRRQPIDQEKTSILADLMFNNTVSGIALTVSKSAFGDLKFDVGNRHAQDAKMWFEMAMCGLNSTSMPVPTAVTRFLGTNISQVFPDICSVEAVIGVLDVARTRKAKPLSCAEEDAFLNRLSLNILRSTTMGAWDFPKGFGTVRSLASISLLRDLFPQDWERMLQTLQVLLARKGMPPDRLVSIRHWKSQMEVLNDRVQLQQLVAQTFRATSDARPNSEVELMSLRQRHPSYFSADGHKAFVQ